jgi:hypothetical protein
VHRRNQHHPILDPALLDNGLNLRRDVNVLAVLASMELEIFSVGFHGTGDSILERRVGVNRAIDRPDKVSHLSVGKSSWHARNQIRLLDHVDEVRLQEGRL